MRYMSKCIPKEMRLQPLPENVCTEQRVSEVVRQRIPGHRTSEGENPMAERAATMSWYEEMVAAGRSKLLTTLPQKNLQILLKCGTPLTSGCNLTSLPH